ncbi:MAG: hypothetical protein O2856_08610 [Planctomycetota bacterium]|nr:hypothetical protein [Planctomycetota bacterium]
MPEAEVRQISNFAYLLRSGGLPFLAFGILLSIAGIVLILIRPSTSFE